MEIVWLGYVAGLLTTIGFVPQLVKSWRMKETKDLSLPMLLIMDAGLSLWLIYGMMIGDPALIAANSVSTPITFTLTGLKLRYG